MNILKIIKTMGFAALSTHPLGAAVVGIANSVLPEENKINVEMSGDYAMQHINKAGEDIKIQLAALELQETKEQELTKRYEAMTKADGQETRAQIVKNAMAFLCFLSSLFVISIAYTYSTNGAEAAFSLDMAAVFGVVVSPFAYVVRAYFGDLRTETESRHAAINGNEKIGAIAGLVKAFRK
jgi:hypothetical protein